MGDKIEIRNRIKDLLNIYHLSQKELCDKCDITPTAMSNYINGKRTPRQDAICKICEPFDIDPAWLMGYNVPMKKNSEEYNVGNALADMFVAQDGFAKRLLAYYSALNQLQKTNLENTIKCFADATGTDKLLDK